MSRAGKRHNHGERMQSETKKARIAKHGPKNNESPTPWENAKAARKRLRLEQGLRIKPRNERGFIVEDVIEKDRRGNTVYSKRLRFDTQRAFEDALIPSVSEEPKKRKRKRKQ